MTEPVHARVEGPAPTDVGGDAKPSAASARAEADPLARSSPRRRRASHTSLWIQRELGRVFWWWLSPICWALMAVWQKYRFPEMRKIRARYRELIDSCPGGVLLCPNHLTMIDSALLVWALYPYYLFPFRWRLLFWNLPEAAYMKNPLFRFVCYFAKCVPVARGGKPDDLRRVLERIDALLGRGELVLIFPEGRRSRTGRIDTGANAHGVGRLIRQNPGTKVLCIYQRGRTQKTFSGIPPKGDLIDIDMELIEPKSDHVGTRGTKEMAQQVLDTLARMERKWLEARGWPIEPETSDTPAASASEPPAPKASDAA